MLITSVFCLTQQIFDVTSASLIREPEARLAGGRLVPDTNQWRMAAAEEKVRTDMQPEGCMAWWIEAGE